VEHPYNNQHLRLIRDREEEDMLPPHHREHIHHPINTSNIKIAGLGMLFLKRNCTIPKARYTLRI
jgi:hypothetical protein